MIPFTAGPASGCRWDTEQMKSVHAFISHLQFVLADCIAEGDLVATRYHWEGTHKGDIFGITPTGREVRVAGMDFYRFRNGKLVGHRDCADMQGLFRQLE